MHLGMLYNIFICFVIGFTGLVVFYFLRKIRREKKKEYSEGLDFFSLLLGLLWLFVGTRTFFAWIGRLDLDASVFYWLSGPLTYIHIIPIFYYFGWSFFKDKKTRLLFEGFFTCIVLLTVFTLFQYGFTVEEATYWGTEQTPNPLTNKLFTYGVFLPAFLCIIIEFVRRLKKWKQTKSSTEKQLLGFTLGLLIYATTGIVDALGGFHGWPILLIRIGIMLAPLTFYLSATIEREE